MLPRAETVWYVDAGVGVVPLGARCSRSAPSTSSRSSGMSPLAARPRRDGDGARGLRLRGADRDRRRHVLAPALGRDRVRRDGPRPSCSSAASGVWAVLAGWAIWGFGYTFTSGANDAWLADEVGTERVDRGLPARRPDRSCGRRSSASSPASASALVDLRLPIVLGGVGIDRCSLLFFAFACPRPGSARRRGASAGAFAQRRTPVASGGGARPRPPRAARDPRHRRVRRHVERELRPALAGALIRDVGLPGARRLRARRLVRALRRRRGGPLDRRRAAARPSARDVEPACSSRGAVPPRRRALARASSSRSPVAVARDARLVRAVRRAQPRGPDLLGLAEPLDRRVERARHGDLDHEPGRRGRPVDRRPGARRGRQRLRHPRGALAAGAACLLPALALYGRAIRHGGEEPALEGLPAET